MKTPLFALCCAAFPATFIMTTPAHAGLGDECETDVQCDDGLVCDVVGASGCACPSEGPCEPCETVEERACVPGPCASDADCGDGLVCVSYEVPCVTTSRPDCAPDDADCGAPMPEPEACEPQTESVCAPRWVLPCEADADCGDGFECAAVESCACSGGGSTPGVPTDPTEPAEPSEPADGSSGSGDDDGDAFAPMPPEDDCVCEPSDDKQCRPVEVACDDDAQCPDGWSCERAPTAVTCFDDGSGEANCEEAPAEPVQGSCAPSGWSGGDSRDDDFGIPTGAQEVDNAADPTAPGEDDDGIGGSAASPSSGCGGAPGALAFGVIAGLVLITRRGLFVHM